MNITTTVVVPAYNAAIEIGRCLAALERQTQPRSLYEIIVVDDGSTDGTADAISPADRVRVIRASHRGPAAARNAGVREARGDAVLFTDADCEPTNDWIEQMLAALTDSATVGAKGTYRTRQKGLIPRFVQIEYEEKYERMVRADTIDFVDTYSAAYRRSVFLENGGFDESFPSASVEDQEFSFRLAAQGHRLVFAPRAVVFHRHPATLGAYARRKFRIGYWKAKVHRRHPGKVWNDSHTPATLKAQVGLVLAATGALVAGLANPMALVLFTALVIAFLFTTVPLLVLAVRRDRAVAVVAPGLIVVRALALGLGLVVGILGELARSGRVKRLVDALGALLGLAACAPVMLAIALWIKLDSPGPVFFVQERAGKDGRPFSMFKFRTMVDGAEAMLDQVIGQSQLPQPVFKIPNDPRVTRAGRFLRRFSLDELPQFLNVLRGEMSLVGPRPEELRIVRQYSDWHRLRLVVKPGMTGPMQVDRRGALALDDRVRMEVDYIENYTLWRDCCLLIKTIPAVVRGTGAS